MGEKVKGVAERWELQGAYRSKVAWIWIWNGGQDMTGGGLD